MKIISSSLLCLISILMFSCKKEVEVSKNITGVLHIDIGLTISIQDVNSNLKSTQQTEDFKVTINRVDGSEVMTFDRVTDMPDFIELETGDYYVEAHSDNNLPAAFENPYYYGASEVFTISGNAQQSVTVNCALANTIVTVSYSQGIVDSFDNYTTTVSSELGSLIYLKDETRRGYFQPIPLHILVELTYLKPDGSEINKSLSGDLPGPLANRHYEIHVDASIDEGMATFLVLLDDAEIQVEMIEISDDSNHQQEGLIPYGGLLITEVMYNPSALTDTEGEWFEVYNHSDHIINLQNLIIERDDANSHIITDPINLSPGEYIVFTRSELATNAVNQYGYGSDILLPNTGAVLSIFNEGNGSGPGALIFAVDYGGDQFPEGSGASIGLNPEMTNAAEALNGASWCISTSTYSTGDLGTPGRVNDPCQ